MNTQEISQSNKIRINTVSSEKTIDTMNNCIKGGAYQLKQNTDIMQTRQNKKDPFIESNNEKSQSLLLNYEVDSQQLKLKIRTLQIQVEVQKDTINRISRDKIKLSNDLQNLMSKNNNITCEQLFLRSTNSTTNQQTLLKIDDITKCQKMNQLSSNSNIKTLKQVQYQTTIKNLTMQIQRLLLIKNQCKLLKQTNQNVKIRIHQLLQINQRLNYQNLIYKQAYSQEKNKLSMYIQRVREQQKIISQLSVLNQRLQSKLNNKKLKSKQSQIDSKPKQKQIVQSNVKYVSNKTQHSDWLFTKYQTPKHQGQKIILFKKHIQSNKCSNLTVFSNDHFKLKQIQQKIIALKQQNEQLKKNIFK